MKNINLTLASAALLMAASSPNAALITNGFTYAIATGSDQDVGTHYHSSTGGDFGNPAGLAEVGAFASEEVRGLSEYDVSSQSNAISAFVTFDTYGTGLFAGTNDFAFDGTINILAYQGNNAEDISDYGISTSSVVGSFSTVGLAVGDIFSFDILNIFNFAIDNSWNSLGIRLQTEDNTIGGGAWVFEDFRLTTTNESNVPEPASLTLLCLGLMGIRLTRKPINRYRHESS